MNSSHGRARQGGIREAMGRLASAVTKWTGGTWGFGTAAAIILVWAVSGPLFQWSDTWQLVINTGTTIVTFLMVFLIQRSQNKESLAIQLKLNELVAALEGASNRLIDVEDLSEDELEILHRHYRKLVEIAREDGHLSNSHSIEEAEERAVEKRKRRRGIGGA
ncbi:MAG TPA: low affinity iron permease family protein [Thermoanaerobaculia bacterium]|nr:low affinity iron permease family protein [Thermoanaerobaculia bacterium]